MKASLLKSLRISFIITTRNAWENFTIKTREKVYAKFPTVKILTPTVLKTKVQKFLIAFYNSQSLYIFWVLWCEFFSAQCLKKINVFFPKSSSCQNSDIFVNAKRVSLFWKMSLFWVSLFWVGTVLKFYQMVLMKNLSTREANDEDFENVMNIDRNIYQGRDYLNGFELLIYKQIITSIVFHLKKLRTIKRVHAFTTGSQIKIVSALFWWTKRKSLDSILP